MRERKGRLHEKARKMVKGQGKRKIGGQKGLLYGMGGDEERDRESGEEVRRWKRKRIDESEADR